jgi:hypothetical protein
MAHSTAARKLRKALDAELALMAQRSGQSLFWSTAEETLIERCMSTMDRLGDLQRDYNQAETSKARLAISTEIRLCDGQLARMLKVIRPELPGKPATITTLRARRAADARWAKERERNAAGNG